MDLKDAGVLVTGGSSGIGKAIAKTLAESGARVAITGRDAGRHKSAAQELKVHGICADVSNEADVLRAYSEFQRGIGRLDVLVNNAGLGFFKKLVDFDSESFDKVFATNVRGAMLMAREAARIFAAQKSGNIVNICSTASHRGAPNGSAYYGSKFALRGMTECWRAELRPFNVRVFLVNPSEVITNFGVAAGFDQKDNPTKLRAEDIAHAVKSVLEMNDRGFTTEVTVFATNPKD